MTFSKVNYTMTLSQNNYTQNQLIFTYIQINDIIIIEIDITLSLSKKRKKSCK